jgi:3-methylcrotonyl-CoA carboxylase beta subunit
VGRASFLLRSAAFAANAAAMRALVEDLPAKVAAIKEGGGEGPRCRHPGHSKLLPFERVRALLDPGSPFLEFAQLGAYGNGEVPAAGIITGIGRIVFGQDAISLPALTED